MDTTPMDLPPAVYAAMAAARDANAVVAAAASASATARDRLVEASKLADAAREEMHRAVSKWAGEPAFETVMRGGLRG